MNPGLDLSTFGDEEVRFAGCEILGAPRLRRSGQWIVRRGPVRAPRDHLSERPARETVVVTTTHLRGTLAGEANIVMPIEDEQFSHRGDSKLLGATSARAERTRRRRISVARRHPAKSQSRRAGRNDTTVHVDYDESTERPSTAIPPRGEKESPGPSAARLVGTDRTTRGSDALGTVGSSSPRVRQWYQYLCRRVTAYSVATRI